MVELGEAEDFDYKNELNEEEKYVASYALLETDCVVDCLDKCSRLGEDPGVDESRAETEVEVFYKKLRSLEFPDGKHPKDQHDLGRVLHLFRSGIESYQRVGGTFEQSLRKLGE